VVLLSCHHPLCYFQGAVSIPQVERIEPYPHYLQYYSPLLPRCSSSSARLCLLNPSPKFLPCPVVLSTTSPQVHPLPFHPLFLRAHALIVVVHSSLRSFASALYLFPVYWYSWLLVSRPAFDFSCSHPHTPPLSSSPLYEGPCGSLPPGSHAPSPPYGHSGTSTRLYGPRSGPCLSEDSVNPTLMLSPFVCVLSGPDIVEIVLLYDLLQPTPLGPHAVVRVPDDRSCLQHQCQGIR